MSKSSVLLSFILITFLFGCDQKKETAAKSSNTEQKAESLIQSKDDLLTGMNEAVAYSGFRSGQHPDRGDGAVNPTDEEILEDLNMLIDECDFRLIRLYDCGVNSQDVLRVIDQNNLDIKVMLGIWLRAEISNHEGCPWLTEPIPQKTLDANVVRNAVEIEKGIELANRYPEIVAAVNVGNEALVSWNDHMVGTDTVISYVKKVKNSIRQPVTVAENFDWWAKNGTELAKAVDFVGVHVYPLWEGEDIDEGLSYSIENMQRVKDALPESQLVITEAGWATVATEFGERASEEKQVRYFQEMMSWSKETNITIFFFEAFDEDWKGDPGKMMGAEKHWGLFTVDRKPKKVATELFAKESSD